MKKPAGIILKLGLYLARRAKQGWLKFSQLLQACHERRPIRPAFLAMTCLFLLFINGCTGSGAVNPLQPTNASKTDPASSADSDVIYWSSFPVTFTLTDPLNGVFLISKKLGWACGNNGVVLKYDGETWEKIDTGLAKTENLLAAAFANENEGWIVGSHGTILSYKNGNWSQDDSQTQENLYSVAVTRSRTVWVVGSNGTVLTYNGISWGKIGAFASDTPGAAPITLTEDLYSVGLSDQNNGWAVGNRGTILRYDGQRWQPYLGAPPSTERLNSVSTLSGVQAWIVGAFGTILRFNGTTWNKMGSAFSGFDLYQISMKDDNDGWAVGQDGTLIYYDGSRWISHQKPLNKPSLNALSFYKDLGFAVGTNGTILKFQPNGEAAKISFLFKGEVTKKPTKSSPFWTITYNLMNQSPKISPFLTFDMPLPKGLEPYQKKDTPTPTPGAGVTTGQVSASPTPTPSAGTPSVGSGPVSGGPSASTGRVATAVMGNWKMKDNQLTWEIGTVASSELKTVTLLLQDKKNEKKEYPVLLKAVLKSTDRDIAEAAAVTMISAEPPAAQGKGKFLPPTTKGTSLQTNSTPTSTDQKDIASEKGGLNNAEPTPAPGN